MAGWNSYPDKLWQLLAGNSTWYILVDEWLQQQSWRPNFMHNRDFEHFAKIDSHLQCKMLKFWLLDFYWELVCRWQPFGSNEANLETWSSLGSSGLWPRLHHSYDSAERSPIISLENVELKVPASPLAFSFVPLMIRSKLGASQEEVRNRLSALLGAL